MQPADAGHARLVWPSHDVPALGPRSTRSEGLSFANCPGIVKLNPGSKVTLNLPPLSSIDRASLPRMSSVERSKTPAPAASLATASTEATNAARCKATILG